MFMHKIRTLCEECGELDIAVEESIRECIAEGILSEFLKENKGEVMSFIEVQLSAGEREAIREQDGYLRGKAQANEETALRMKEKGFDYEVISEITNLPIEEIKKL